MSSIWQARPILAFAIVLAASWLNAAQPRAQGAPAQGSLAGQLLIASPAMEDPRFERAVILIVRHGKDGAFGLVINRPIRERPLAEILAMLGDKDAPVAGNVRIFYGGPVSPDRSFILHSTDYDRPGTYKIDERAAITASVDILRDIGNSQGPQKSLIAFGYAGWGPGQIEGELARRAWVTMTSVAPSLIFDEDRDKVWDAAYAQRGQDL